MSDPYVGEIRMFAGNFAPLGWAFCDGQLLAVAQHDALFSLFGTTYGGDGRTTFGLPDMRGRLPIHQGDGPGLTDRPLGQKGGSEKVTLITSQLPTHNHDLVANTQPATSTAPANLMPAQGVGVAFYAEQAPNEMMAPTMLHNTGGNQSHNNLMPSLCVNFIVALVGIYPSRN